MDKDGQEGEEEAKKAYIVASDSEHAVEKAVDDSVSSTLIDRVRSLACVCRYMCVSECVYI